jgi:hypothetical protein
MNKIRVYKVFDPDWKCKGFQYEVGKTYSMKEDPILCERGFHGCKKVNDCFTYYSFDPKNKVAECELFGTVIGEDGNKQAGNNITILKEISWEEMLVLANTGSGNSGHSNSGSSNSGNSNSGHSNSGGWNSGSRNSGYCNSGYCNSGYSNSGNSNSGYCNSGHSNSGSRNSGYCNSGDWNSGFFNNDTPNTVRVFGKDCNRDKWNNAIKPNFIFNINPCLWISWDDMTDSEKANNKNAFVTEGYLKTLTYKEAWAEAYKGATEEDIILLKALPNFNAKIFFDITGIQIK